MNRLLYLKLARTNIRKNVQVYVPFILTCTGMILVYYILRSMAFNEYIYHRELHREAFEGAETIAAFLEIASNTAGIFSFIFLLFTNSFVMKRQKKQLGLYSIMGMERKHIAYVLLMEMLISSAVSLAAGLLCGLLLDKLMLMLLLKILKKDVPAGFYFNGDIVVRTVVLFAAAFAFALIINMFQVVRSSTIDLLKGDHMGEKEPKTKLILALLGCISLSIGYAIAVRVNNTIDAITYFFPAVIFVMIGTYFIFIAGSIAVLKILRKNKRFYYKTQNFINISGMIYRMKQNAAGLASICLLSTSAILVLSAGAALYAGGENSIAKEFPREIKISVHGGSEQTVSAIEACIQSTEADTGMEAENKAYYTFSETCMILEQNELNYIARMMSGGVYDVFFLTQQEYNRFAGEGISLDDNEILLYDMSERYQGSSITIGGNVYQIANTFKNDCIHHMKNTSMSLFPNMVIVVKDMEALYRAYGEYANEAVIICNYGFDVEGSQEKISHFGQLLAGKLKENNLPDTLSLKKDLEAVFLATYGSAFYIGIFLGALFLIATVLIIYYKQISEGFDDRERFIIMQKVGMTKEEIKKTIHTQVLMVFFLPLAAAILHMTFALHIVTLFIRSVVLINTPLMIICAAVTSLIFSLVYCAVYGITSKEYYRIVNE